MARVNQRALVANQRADGEGYQAHHAMDLKIAGKKGDEFNPYARRRVKPKVLWKVGKALRETEEEAKAEEKKEAREEVPKEVHTVDLNTPNLVQETEKAAALNESHQFAIDEEGLVQSSALGSLGLGGKRIAHEGFARASVLHNIWNGRRAGPYNQSRHRILLSKKQNS
jgi:hypothetical protein